MSKNKTPANKNSVKREPNNRMREVMKKAQAVLKNMRQTDSSQTQQILRKGRGGGVFGK